MVDKNVDLPRYKRTGAILTLNTDDAVRSGIASGTAPSLDAALAQLDLAGAPARHRVVHVGRAPRALRDRSRRERPAAHARHAGPAHRDADAARHRRSDRRRRARAVLRNARLRRILQRLRLGAGRAGPRRHPLGAARRTGPRVAGYLGRRRALRGGAVGVRTAISLRRHRDAGDGHRADGHRVHAGRSGGAAERVGAPAGSRGGAGPRLRRQRRPPQPSRPHGNGGQLPAPGGHRLDRRPASGRPDRG